MPTREELDASIIARRMAEDSTTKPKSKLKTSIKFDALVGFALVFALAWIDNYRDMALAMFGVLLYVLCEIAERLKTK